MQPVQHEPARHLPPVQVVPDSAVYLQVPVEQFAVWQVFAGQVPQDLSPLPQAVLAVPGLQVPLLRHPEQQGPLLSQ